MIQLKNSYFYDPLVLLFFTVSVLQTVDVVFYCSLCAGGQGCGSVPVADICSQSVNGFRYHASWVVALVDVV